MTRNPHRRASGRWWAFGFGYRIAGPVIWLRMLTGETAERFRRADRGLRGMILGTLGFQAGQLLKIPNAAADHDWSEIASAALTVFILAGWQVYALFAHDTDPRHHDAVLGRRPGES